MALYTASSFKSELNDKGWRMTPQRETILHVFQNLPKGNHLSAEDLYTLLKNRGENISLSTIYRTLKLMARMSLLRELELAEGHKHYEINQPYPHHHHHLVCVQCNRTIEFNNDSILKIGMKQAEKSGLHLLDCQLTHSYGLPRSFADGMAVFGFQQLVLSEVDRPERQHRPGFN
jgi:Fur family ferric uptake transcriptional regulator